MHRIDIISLKITRIKLSSESRKKWKIDIRQQNWRRTETITGNKRTKWKIQKTKYFCLCLSGQQERETIAKTEKPGPSEQIQTDRKRVERRNRTAETRPWFLELNSYEARTETKRARKRSSIPSSVSKP